MIVEKSLIIDIWARLQVGLGKEWNNVYLYICWSNLIQ